MRLYEWGESSQQSLMPYSLQLGYGDHRWRERTGVEKEGRVNDREVTENYGNGIEGCDWKIELLI